MKPSEGEKLIAAIRELIDADKGASAVAQLTELQKYLDAIRITPDNIGDIRRSLFVSCESAWNGWVRDETAKREAPAPASAPPLDWTPLDGSLTIRFLQYINATRAARWHQNGGIKGWSALEWAGAMAGEAGEACNAAKKLKRIDDQIANINLEEGRSLTDVQNASAQVVDEIADTVIYGVLLAERVGLDLEEAIRMKFNRKSEEYGFPERIPPNGPLAAAPPRETPQPLFGESHLACASGEHLFPKYVPVPCQCGETTTTAETAPRETQAPPALREMIEQVRVECSQHKSVDWALGAVYALDTLKHRLVMEEKR